MSINIDFNKKVRAMKPVHGVNNGPVTCNFLRDASEWFVKAGIPYSRLHDTEGVYGAGEFVDIPAIFKDFDANPEDENSYNFMLTDEYIKAIRATGTKVIYRLGVSIENGPFKKYIYPPKDYLKWAKICEGIIKHYTQGWANGFTDAVEYFEIWNEPELIEHMWIGTFEEFYELFKTSITYLKSKFPNVKIGGPAIAYTDDEFVKGFFEYMTKGKRAPLDFFSFHTYFSSVKLISERFELSESILKKYGYGDAELLCTEWNYIDDWTDMEKTYEVFCNIRGASFAAAALCEFQKANCTIANYYDAQMRSPFNGLFKVVSVKRHDGVQKIGTRCAYYAFEKYNDLYRLGTEVFSEADEDNVFTVAASDGQKCGVLISRFDRIGEKEKVFSLNIKNALGKALRAYAIDNETESLKLVYVGEMPKEIMLEKYSTVYMEWYKDEGVMKDLALR